MIPQLKDRHLNYIRETIQTELLKRGFQADVIELEQKKDKLHFKTDFFQTTPVIFKTLYIGNFNSSITKDFNGNISVFIGVNVFYTLFNSGSNSTNLFGLSFHFNEYSSDYKIV